MFSLTPAHLTALYLLKIAPLFHILAVRINLMGNYSSTYFSVLLIANLVSISPAHSYLYTVLVSSAYIFVVFTVFLAFIHVLTMSSRNSRDFSHWMDRPTMIEYL